MNGDGIVREVEHVNWFSKENSSYIAVSAVSVVNAHA
jgi:hypothetical protein